MIMGMKTSISKESKQPRLWNQYYLVTIVLLAFNGMVMALFNNTIALHTDALGLGVSASGMLVSLGTIVTLIYRFFSAVLTDRIGRQKITCIGMLIMLVGNTLCAFSSGISILVLGRALQMLGFAVISTSTAIIVVDVIPRERMGEGIGYSSLGGSLAQAITPSLALALYTVSAFRGTMLFAASIATVGLVLAAFFLGYERKTFYLQAKELESGATVHRRIRLSDLVEPAALHATFVGLASTMAVTLVSMYLTHYAVSNGIENIGLYFVCSSVVMVIARMTTSKFSDRFSTLTSVVPGYLLLTVSILIIPAIRQYPFLIFASGALNGFGQGMAVPAINAQAVRSAHESRRSVASSTYLLGHDVGFIVGPTLWGTLIERIGYHPAFWMAGGFVILGLAYAIIVFRKRK